MLASRLVHGFPSPAEAWRVYRLTDGRGLPHPVLDELFESLTLIQTGRTMPIPLVMLAPEGDDFWPDWLHDFQQGLARRGLRSIASRPRQPLQSAGLLRVRPVFGASTGDCAERCA